MKVVLVGVFSTDIEKYGTVREIKELSWDRVE